MESRQRRSAIGACNVVLNERTPLVPIRAVDAAVAGFRTDRGVAARAFPHNDAAVGGHPFGYHDRTHRTSHRDTEISLALLPR